ncbi:MAG: glycoside hydrolase, partial [Halanaerobium sp.]
MIVGGGGVRTPQVTNGLLAKSRELELKEITLLDIDKKRLDAIYKIVNQIKTSHQNVEDVAINYTLDSKKAFKEADLILFTVRVGDIKSRIIDERVPLKYGVVGQETTGPGGFAMAMRTIPVILEYVKEIKKTAPDAWILNLTNPAGLITQALNDAGYEKIIGICDSPSGLTEDIAAGLDLPLSELWFEYFGLNHLGWIKKVKHKNKDITAEVFENEKALKRHGEAMISADFIRRLSLIPNEYLLFYYQNTEVVNKVSDSGLSRAQLIDKLNKLLFNKLNTLDQNSDPDPLTIYQRYIEARHGSYMQVETAGFN